MIRRNPPTLQNPPHENPNVYKHIGGLEGLEGYPVPRTYARVCARLHRTSKCFGGNLVNPPTLQLPQKPLKNANGIIGFQFWRVLPKPSKTLQNPPDSAQNRPRAPK